MKFPRENRSFASMNKSETNQLVRFSFVRKGNKAHLFL